MMSVRLRCPRCASVAWLPLFCALALLCGCAQPGSPSPLSPNLQKEAGLAGKAVSNFDPKQIGKSDVDRVADAHRRAVFASLRVVAEKLYRRNPREWRKSAASVEQAMDALFDPRTGWRHPALATARGTDVIVLGLREDFSGDRVAAFIAGLGGMLNDAFDNKTEFFLTDAIDPQKLYNSARNIEIAAWKLASARDGNGGLLLVSNEMPPPPQSPNLSFEREFGKMIGNLDLLAATIADRDNRTIARIAQNIATALFLPVAAFR